MEIKEVRPLMDNGTRAMLSTSQVMRLTRPPPTRRPLPRPLRNSDGTVLAAVLGSIGFVCIAVVIVVLLMKRRQEISSNKSHSSVSSQVSGTYETIGPALPPMRDTGKSISTFERPAPSTHKNKNIYAKDNLQSDAHYVAPATLPQRFKQEESRSKPAKVEEKEKPPSHGEENEYLQPIRPLGTLPMDEDDYVQLGAEDKSL